MKIKLSITQSLIFFVMLGTCIAKPQELILFSGEDETGTHFERRGTNAKNLADYNFDDKARSICATGIWLLYEEQGFNPGGNSEVEYYFNRVNKCMNLQSLSGKVSSVRFAGASLDFTTDTFSIYEHTLFQGQEEYILMNYSNLMLNDTSGSIIITGSADWTVYDKPIFSGNSICIRANQDRSPVLYYDLENTEGFPKINYGAIKSVSQGCKTLAEEAINALNTSGNIANFGKQ